MGASYTVAKLPVDDAEKFCAWCLSNFRYVDEQTAGKKPSLHQPDVVTEIIMRASAVGFYTNPELGKNQPNAFGLCAL